MNPRWTLTALLLLLFSANLCSQSQYTSLSLEDLNGNRHQLGEYLKSGPVYLSFWALWCDPCKQELHALKALAARLKDKPVTFIAINTDTPKSLAKVKGYVRSQDIPFPVAVDPNGIVFQALSGQNLPYSLLFDKNGTISATHSGYLPGDDRAIEKEILDLLK
jgi:cytochrome c biogenesis protein CcmG, thiol:disulfide interchange protein DsbE